MTPEHKVEKWRQKNGDGNDVDMDGMRVEGGGWRARGGGETGGENRRERHWVGVYSIVGIADIVRSPMGYLQPFMADFTGLRALPT